MKNDQITAKITTTIYETIDELNEQLSDGEKIEKSLNTKLFGDEGCLDSLGLVNLVTLAEEKVEAALGLRIFLTDDRALTQDESPFKSVQSLIQYIALLYQESQGS